MAVKKFGRIIYEKSSDEWIIQQAEPHVCIKLKNIFPKIPTYKTVPFHFANTPENCTDLLWFTDRYPLEITASHRVKLLRQKKIHTDLRNEIERIMMPGRKSKIVKLKNGLFARDYQEKVAELNAIQKRFLLGDDIGLGKTLSGILTLTNKGRIPAIVVVQTHLTTQWKSEIEKFTNLAAHIIKGTKPYNLPASDVYIIKYSCLSGWVDIFRSGFFKTAIFDEAQELRRKESEKYESASSLSKNVESCIALTATPIYNYGNEIFNVLDLINPGCLGNEFDFLREWCVASGNHHLVQDTAALGTYLRENHLFLRRTRKEVGRELPVINKVIEIVDYNEKDVKKVEDIARMLAIKATTASFVERGQAARELNALVRHTTGVSKARSVANFCKIFLDNKIPILLAGWHRDVYKIWIEELAEYKPVFYTGQESDTQKEKAKQAFINGETDLFIISLRSGIGLDGLQKRCKDVVIGEMDWSPKVHDQLIGRIDRDGQQDQVSAYFLVSEYGSDPVIIDILGLKSSQSEGIIDPLKVTESQYSDESRLIKLAESILKNKN